MKRTLKEIRMEKGIKLIKVAEELGISIGSLSKKENGISQFTAKELSKLIIFYGVTFEDVLI